MDYAKQDTADLRELLELYRDGHGTDDCLSRISQRWVEQGRLSEAERSERNAPSMRDTMDLVQHLMADSPKR